MTLSALDFGLPCAGGAGSGAAEAASSFKLVARKAVKVFGCTTGVVVDAHNCIYFGVMHSHLVNVLDTAPDVPHIQLESCCQDM